MTSAGGHVVDKSIFHRYFGDIIPDECITAKTMERTNVMFSSNETVAAPVEIAHRRLTIHSMMPKQSYPRQDGHRHRHQKDSTAILNWLGSHISTLLWLHAKHQ